MVAGMCVWGQAGDVPCRANCLSVLSCPVHCPTCPSWELCEEGRQHVCLLSLSMSHPKIGKGKG